MTQSSPTPESSEKESHRHMAQLQSYKLPPASSPQPKGSEERPSSAMRIGRARMAEELVQASEQSFIRQKYKVLKNKDNGGHLFDDCGVPFWSSTSKQAKEVCSERHRHRYGCLMINCI
ncbi:hypothetical protein Tcan_06684 [Toxocara canis]|uniref:Uncharacterized protein n=1 Tax=Toxocara canis TaxID=6265 RepID=A0A0B2VH35_TOXCA|nr:hypothetical protein Tcan_06684 [Toxocara canis]